MKKHIYFLLPGVDYDIRKQEFIPIGGFKVVYEYTNRLAVDGYEVSLVYPRVITSYSSFLNRIVTFLGWTFRKITRSHKAGEWYTLDKRINKTFCYDLSRFWLPIPKEALVVATAYKTAYYLNQRNDVRPNNKIYLIQDYELWSASAQQLATSYNWGMKNITIAPWLQKCVQDAGAEASVVMNGLDFERFNLYSSIDSRNQFEIVMLYHTLEHKRCQDAWNALSIVKEKYPQLHVTMFGTFSQPNDMPNWYTYYKLPNKKIHNAIYNQGAIYVAASDYEGFGLTIGEAMICGCAIACTDNGGFRCMAKHEKTALLSPIYDVQQLASNIIRLIEDDAFRIRLAKEGNQYIQQFTWQAAYKQFKHIIGL